MIKTKQGKRIKRGYKLSAKGRKAIIDALKSRRKKYPRKPRLV